jgi:hypothetical protein
VRRRGSAHTACGVGVAGVRMQPCCGHATPKSLLSAPPHPPRLVELLYAPPKRGLVYLHHRAARPRPSRALGCCCAGGAVPPARPWPAGRAKAHSTIHGTGRERELLSRRCVAPCCASTAWRDLLQSVPSSVETTQPHNKKLCGLECCSCHMSVVRSLCDSTHHTLHPHPCV